MPPIRLALAGAGLFARDAHLPAIQSLGDTYEIAAVYSYRKSSAEKLLAMLPQPVDLYDDLETLLRKEDIDALDIILPIDVMPSVVEQALRAGKHVISEKPIAADVATGLRMMTTYEGHWVQDQVWMVAENWRYEPAFAQAGQIVRSGEIGQPYLVTWTQHADMTPANKYYHTEWRRTGTWQGGFLMDGGVHHIAVLRQIAGEIVQVSALAAQHRVDLPPADTLSAALRFENGAVGGYNITYGAGAPWPWVIQVVGSKGSMGLFGMDRIEVTTEGKTRVINVPPGNGVRDELAAFAKSIREGVPHANTPTEALRDVAVIEAMLRSSEEGRRIEPEKI